MREGGFERRPHFRLTPRRVLCRALHLSEHARPALRHSSREAPHARAPLLVSLAHIVLERAQRHELAPRLDGRLSHRRERHAQLRPDVERHARPLALLWGGQEWAGGVRVTANEQAL